MTARGMDQKLPHVRLKAPQLGTGVTIQDTATRCAKTDGLLVLGMEMMPSKTFTTDGKQGDQRPLHRLGTPPIIVPKDLGHFATQPQILQASALIRARNRATACRRCRTVPKGMRALDRVPATAWMTTIVADTETCNKKAAHATATSSRGGTMMGRTKGGIFTKGATTLFSSRIVIEDRSPTLI